MKCLFLKFCVVLFLFGTTAFTCFAQESEYKSCINLAEKAYTAGDSLLEKGDFDKAIKQFEDAKRCYEDANKAEGKPQDFDLEARQRECNDKIEEAKKGKKEKSSTPPQPNISEPKDGKGKTVIVPISKAGSGKTSSATITKEESDNFSIKEGCWKESEPIYSGDDISLTPRIRYTCDKEISISLTIEVENPDKTTKELSQIIDVKKTSVEETWCELDKYKINGSGKYSFKFYRTINGEKRELTTQNFPEVKEKPQTITISKDQTKKTQTTLKVNENILIFEAKGGIKYVNVDANPAEWDLEGISISGFKITKFGTNVIRVECSPATSTASVNAWFKVKAGEQEAKITVFREGQKVIMQSYEQSIKGNPFALRTNKWNTYHWGISAGYVSKKLKYKDLDGNTNNYGLLSDKSMQGMQVGMHYEGFFMPKICGLGIATGAYYEYYWQKGDTQTSNEGDDYYASYKEHNVYVPLNLLFRFDFSKKVNIALYGGIGGNYGVGNKVEYKNDSNDETFEEKKGLYDYDEYGIKHFFMNIEYGGSVRFGRLSVNARFFSPLTDWSEDKFYSEKPQKDMNLSVSFMF